MPTVIGVAFRPVTKVYYFYLEQLTDLQPDEYVLVQTSRGWTMGQVVFSPREGERSGGCGDFEASRASCERMGHGSGGPDGASRTQACELSIVRAKALGMNIKISKVEFSIRRVRVQSYTLRPTNGWTSGTLYMTCPDSCTRGRDAPGWCARRVSRPAGSANAAASSAALPGCANLPPYPSRWRRRKTCR